MYAASPDNPQGRRVPPSPATIESEFSQQQSKGSWRKSHAYSPQVRTQPCQHPISALRDPSPEFGSQHLELIHGCSFNLQVCSDLLHILEKSPVLQEQQCTQEGGGRKHENRTCGLGDGAASPMEIGCVGERDHST